MRYFDAQQNCNDCNETFTVRYWENGSYDYMDDACECEESGFSPLNGVPSISQWLESLR